MAVKDIQKLTRSEGCTQLSLSINGQYSALAEVSMNEREAVFITSGGHLPHQPPQSFGADQGRSRDCRQMGGNQQTMPAPIPLRESYIGLKNLQ